jgi:recombination protein RecA
MRSALSKAQIESDIAVRFSDAFKVHEKAAAETLSTGIAEVDASTGGIPRGAITEIFGPRSSGRTSLMYSLLAYATAHDEICALVDTNDVFAPAAAATAAIDFDRLLWIRCAANLEHAFKATDLLLHAGGFGLVILDLGDVAGKDARRIISSWWYRFRRTVENRPTSVVVISEEACTRSCAALTLELHGQADWSRASISYGNLLRFNSINVNRCRPLWRTSKESQFTARAIA